jgi:hypothetical protein
MTEEATKRKHDSRWPDRTITKRSQNRRADRHKLFVAAGWSGESEFLTAVGNRDVEIPTKPGTAPQPAQKEDES